MFLLGVIVNIPLAKWVYENSAKPYITLLVYFILNFSFYGTTGYRQTIALTLAVFIGFKFIKKRRLIPFLVIIVIAFFFHKSALIVCLFYVLSEKKITTKYLLCTSIGIIIVFIFRAPFSQFWKNISGYGQMYTGQYEGAGTWTFTAMLLLVLVVAVCFRSLILKKDANAIRYINATILASIFVPLTYINPSSMRIVGYFSIYLGLLIPDLLLVIKDKDRKLAEMLIVVLLTVLYLKSGQTFSFMWNEI